MGKCQYRQMVGRRARISRTGGPWGAEVEYAYRVGYDSRGRVSVTHLVDERGLFCNADETGAGRRRSWGGPNLPLSTDTATTETGTTPVRCPLPDTEQRTGGRACTGQRPPPRNPPKGSSPCSPGPSSWPRNQSSPRSAAASLFEWALTVEQERETEPVDAGR